MNGIDEEEEQEEESMRLTMNTLVSATGTWDVKRVKTTGTVPVGVEGASYAHRRASQTEGASASQRETSTPTNVSTTRAVTFAFGGATRQGKLTNDVHVLDCETKVWIKLATKGEKPSPRMGQAMALREGRLFVHGGRSVKVSGGERGKKNADDALEDEYLADAYELNLHSLTWRQVTMKGGAPSPRAFHTINALSAMLVCFGGDNGKEFLSETHYMRYSDEKWRQADLNESRDDERSTVCWPNERACHTATSLLDGDTVIVFGGIGKNSVALGDTWSWSASELRWTPLEPPSRQPEGRFMHAATTVGDGLAIYGGMALTTKGANSKIYQVFDHMYILTGLQLMAHPMWQDARSEGATKQSSLEARDKNNATKECEPSPPPIDSRRSFSQDNPENLPPKKKLSAAVKILRKSSGASSDLGSAPSVTIQEVEEAMKATPHKAPTKQEVPPPKPSSKSVAETKKLAQAKAKNSKGRDVAGKVSLSVQVSTDSRMETERAAGKTEIPLPGVKLAPPDGADEPTESAPSSVVPKESVPVPGVKPAPPDDEDDEGDMPIDGKSTPSPPVESAPPKRGMPIPGVRLAPVNDDEWEELDPDQRMPSVETSADEDGSLPDLPPFTFEWVTSEDGLYSIMIDKSNGRELRRIPLPPELALFKVPDDVSKSVAPERSQATPKPVKQHRSDYSEEERRLAISFFETFELNKHAPRYDGLDPASVTKEIEKAWRELGMDEKEEWYEMSRGPPSSRKKMRTDTEEIDDEERAWEEAIKVTRAQANMQVRAEMAHNAGIANFRGADTSLLGEHVTGVVTGGFDAGYFATMRLQGPDGPQNYRAILFSPVLCSQRVVTTEEGQKEPLIVMPSYCIPGTSSSVARNIVFTRKNENTGRIHAESVWGRPLCVRTNASSADPSGGLRVVSSAGDPVVLTEHVTQARIADDLD